MPGSEVHPPSTQHRPWKGRANTCAPLSSASLCPVSLWSPHYWHRNQHPWDEGFGSPPPASYTESPVLQLEKEGATWGRGPGVWTWRIGSPSRVLGQKGGKGSEVGAGPGAWEYLPAFWGAPSLGRFRAAGRSAVIACQSLAALLKRQGLLGAKGRRQKGEG